MVRATTPRRSRALFVGLHARASARSGVLDLDDLLLLLARAGRATRSIGAAAARRRSTTCWSTSTRTSTGSRSTSSAALRSDARRTSPSVGDDLQAIYGFRSASAEHILAFPEHFPGAAVVTLERNYRADPAAPRRRQRGRGAGRARVPASACAPSAPGGRAPELVLLPRRGRPGDRGLRARARRARAGRRAARAGGAHARRRTTPTCSSSSSRAAASRSSSTAACATWRPRTSRTSSRCCAWPTTRPTTSRGSACCSCSRASARRRARRVLDGARAATPAG